MEEKIDQLQDSLARFDKVKEMIQDNPELLKKWYALPLEEQVKIVELAEERASAKAKQFVEGFEALEEKRKAALKAEQRARDELKEKQERRARAEDDHERALREEYVRRELEQRTPEAAKAYWLGVFVLSFLGTRLAFQSFFA